MKDPLSKKWHDMSKSGKGYDALIEWLNYGSERIQASLEVTRSEEDSPDYFLDTKNQNGFVLDFYSGELRHRTGYNIAAGLDVQLNR